MLTRASQQETPTTTTAAAAAASTARCAKGSAAAMACSSTSTSSEDCSGDRSGVRGTGWLRWSNSSTRRPPRSPQSTPTAPAATAASPSPRLSPAVAAAGRGDTTPAGEPRAPTHVDRSQRGFPALVQALVCRLLDVISLFQLRQCSASWQDAALAVLALPARDLSAALSVSEGICPHSGVSCSCRGRQMHAWRILGVLFAADSFARFPSRFMWSAEVVSWFTQIAKAAGEAQSRSWASGLLARLVDEHPFGSLMFGLAVVRLQPSIYMRPPSLNGDANDGNAGTDSKRRAGAQTRSNITFAITSDSFVAGQLVGVRLALYKHLFPVRTAAYELSVVLSSVVREARKFNFEAVQDWDNGVLTRFLRGVRNAWSVLESLEPEEIGKFGVCVPTPQPGLPSGSGVTALSKDSAKHTLAPVEPLCLALPGMARVILLEEMTHEFEIDSLSGAAAGSRLIGPSTNDDLWDRVGCRHNFYMYLRMFGAAQAIEDAFGIRPSYTDAELSAPASSDDSDDENGGQHGRDERCTGIGNMNERNDEPGDTNTAFMGGTAASAKRPARSTKFGSLAGINGEGIGREETKSLSNSAAITTAIPTSTSTAPSSAASAKPFHAIPPPPRPISDSTASLLVRAARAVPPVVPPPTLTVSDRSVLLCHERDPTGAVHPSFRKVKGLADDLIAAEREAARKLALSFALARRAAASGHDDESAFASAFYSNNSPPHVPVHAWDADPRSPAQVVLEKIVEACDLLGAADVAGAGGGVTDEEDGRDGDGGGGGWDGHGFGCFGGDGGDRPREGSPSVVRGGKRRDEAARSRADAVLLAFFGRLHEWAV